MKQIEQFLEKLGQIFSGDSRKSEATVIQTIDDQHVGFTLFRTDTKSQSGYCVFLIVPNNSSLFELAEVQILFEIREYGEYFWEKLGEDIIVKQAEEEILKYCVDGKIYHIPSGIQLGKWIPVSSGNVAESVRNG